MDVVDAGTPIVCSPLGRARQTAEAVAEATGGSVVTHPGLIETDFGTWEGLTFAEAAQRDPEIHRAWVSDSSKAPPGGESFDIVHHRVRRVRDELISTHGGATIILVSHVTPIKLVLRDALEATDGLLHRLFLDAAGISVVDFWPDGGIAVRTVNDTAHLAR